jgi:hypothetical protein
MQRSFGVHHNSQVALDLITYKWLPMILKRKRIIVARSEGTDVLEVTIRSWHKVRCSDVGASEAGKYFSCGEPRQQARFFLINIRWPRTID